MISVRNLNDILLDLHQSQFVLCSLWRLEAYGTSVSSIFNPRSLKILGMELVQLILVTSTFGLIITLILLLQRLIIYLMDLDFSGIEFGGRLSLLI